MVENQYGSVVSAFISIFCLKQPPNTHLFFFFFFCFTSLGVWARSFTDQAMFWRLGKWLTSLTCAQLMWQAGKEEIQRAKKATFRQGSWRFQNAACIRKNTGTEHILLFKWKNYLKTKIWEAQPFFLHAHIPFVPKGWIRFACYFKCQRHKPSTYIAHTWKSPS